MEGILVSILIPTYNDWARLALCLQALAAQSFPKEQFEVLIINNNPHDQAPADLLLPPHFKMLTEAKPGSYAARNTGLKHARGTIIGFTDSDCIPDPSWIENAVSYLAQHNTCSRVAGRVMVFSTSTRTTLGEKYDMLYAFPQQQYVARGSSITANLFTYKSVFETAGFFDERLLSNGDLEWGRQAQKTGFAVHYVENVVVKHPARRLKELIKKERRVGGGRGLAERRWNNKFSNLLRLLNGFRPRLAEVRYVYHMKNVQTIDKIKILLLRHYLLQVRALEHLKVQLGKAPKRA